MLELPKECFKYGSGEVQISNEGGKPYDVLSLNTDGVISLNIKDAMFPWEVFTPQEAVFASNAVKSLFIESVKVLVRPQFILGFIYTVWRKKELDRVIRNFNYQAFRILSPYILKHHHLTLVSQETHWCLFTALMELGISEEQSDKFAEIFVHTLEYDNAYRFRFMDLMGAMNKEDFKNPRKAIKKLKKLIKERETDPTSIESPVVKKIDNVLTLISLATYLPRVKYAIIKVAEEMNIKNLQPKESDIYWWCPPQRSYHFMGKNNEERKAHALSKGWTYPDEML